MAKSKFTSTYDTTFKRSDVIQSESGIHVISWDIIKEKLGDEYKQFTEWMNGQSCVAEGAYLCDIKNYFYKRDTDKLNSFPHGY